MTPITKPGITPMSNVTEKDVNAFISELAAKLAVEHGAADVTACFVCMFTGTLGVQKRWSLTVGRDEGGGPTIEDAVRQIQDAYAPTTLASRAALLRKQADELDQRAGIALPIGGSQ